MINGLLSMPFSGDPVPKVGMMAGLIPMSTTKADEDASIRDSLSALVGKGYASFDSDEARGHTARLFSLLGNPFAQKLLTQISLFNRNPYSLNLRPTDKITRFYDTSFLDSDVDSLVKRMKMFGSGPIAGVNDSPDVDITQLRNNNIAKK